MRSATRSIGHSADNKWFTRLVFAAAIVEAVEKLDLTYPMIDPEKRMELQTIRAALSREKWGQSHIEQSRRAPSLRDPPSVSVQISFPIATAVSAMRHENPHSLSYHDITRTSVPSMTFV